MAWADGWLVMIKWCLNVTSVHRFSVIASHNTCARTFRECSGLSKSCRHQALWHNIFLFIFLLAPPNKSPALAYFYELLPLFTLFWSRLLETLTRVNSGRGCHLSLVLYQNAHRCMMYNLANEIFGSSKERRTDSASAHSQRCCTLNAPAFEICPSFDKD